MLLRFSYSTFLFIEVYPWWKGCDTFGSSNSMKMAEKIQDSPDFWNLNIQMNFIFQEISNKITAASIVQIADIFRSNLEVPK